MEVYNELRKDIIILFMLAIALKLVLNYFNYGLDNTDKDGFNRSNVELITDYGTGLQYLYKGGALIPRLDKSGNHVGIK